MLLVQNIPKNLDVQQNETPKVDHSKKVTNMPDSYGEENVEEEKSFSPKIWEHIDSQGGQPLELAIDTIKMPDSRADHGSSLGNPNTKKQSYIHHLIQRDSIVLIGDKLVLRNDLFETSSSDEDSKSDDDMTHLDYINTSDELSQVNHISVQIHDDRGIDLFVDLPKLDSASAVDSDLISNDVNSTAKNDNWNVVRKRTRSRNHRT